MSNFLATPAHPRPPTRATMRAAVLVKPGTIEIHEVLIPQPGPGEVRIRVESCGVCASNLPPWEGKPWFSYPMEPGGLGHEACGHIDALGENVRGLSLGQRVAALSFRAYAEYDVAPAHSVVPLPAALDGEPVPGEPLGCAMNIFERAEIRPGQTVAIVGVGFLGAILTQLAVRRGARVIALSRRPFALKMALSSGATHVLPLDESAVAAVQLITGPRLCDVVIEATGKAQPLEWAAELTRERGRLVIAGYHQDGERRINMQLWNWRGIDVINAHERDPAVCVSGVRNALDAIADGHLDPAPLYTHRLPLKNLAQALDLTRERPAGFFKALVLP